MRVVLHRRAEPVRGRKRSARPFCRRQTFGLMGRTGAARAASASGGILMGHFTQSQNGLRRCSCPQIECFILVVGEVL
ncbi:hypothetical protein PhaeoP10_03003 [Phaeobacter inhibens]|nr:hypothetical protein PhaeoP10_03003 [Phaeobacter inhibens]